MRKRAIIAATCERWEHNTSIRAAVEDAVLRRPRDALIIPVLPDSGVGIHAGEPGQHDIHHGPGHRPLNAEALLCDALEQLAGGHKVDLVLGPVVPGVNEVLGVIHNLHGGAAVDGELDAVRRGQGVLDDLLGAIGMDEDSHCIPPILLGVVCFSREINHQRSPARSRPCPPLFFQGIHCSTNFQLFEDFFQKMPKNAGPRLARRLSPRQSCLTDARSRSKTCRRKSRLCLNPSPRPRTRVSPGALLRG